MKNGQPTQQNLPFLPRVTESELKRIINSSNGGGIATLAAQPLLDGEWILLIQLKSNEGEKETRLILNSQRKTMRIFKSLDSIDKFLNRLNTSCRSYRVNMR